MKRYLLAAMAILALAGCGEARGERTVTGAGIGATAGAVLGAVTGMGVVTGTIAGAAVGGITGMMTDRSQVDLGDPVWKQGSGAQAAPANQNQAAQTQAAPAAGAQQQAAAPADSETVRNIQSGLAKLGFDPGPADGVVSEKTRAAIREFQQQSGLPANGEPTPELAQKVAQQLALRGN